MSEKKQKQKKSLFRRIVNIFLGFFTVIFILLIILFGFSQTSTFRDILRDEIVDAANGSLNGKVSIGKIDGSIFTSLILRNVNVTVEDENLLTAEKIDIKISPLQLLVKRIYFRSIQLQNVDISIFENQNRETNLSRLLQQSEQTTEDTTIAEEPEETSKFPFAIQVNNLNFENINLVLKSYENLNSNKTYPYLNLKDFQLENFNLAAKLLIHNEEDIYQLVFDDFSGKTNISDFEINKLSGTFEITDRYANVKQLNIQTDRSDISLSAFLGQINLLGDIDLENFQKYPLQLELDASPFTFDDLSVFLSGTRLLYGSPSVKLKADGQFGSFNVDHLIVDYDKTHLELAGKLENLHKPKDLFLDVEIKNSSADYATARKLLPDLDIPQFNDLFVTNMNIDFRGQPTVFHANMSAQVGDGYFQTDSYMDVEEDVLRYDINFETENLNLTNIVNVPTVLTSNGKIQGVGLTPEDLDAELDIAIDNSKYKNLVIDSLRFETLARSEIIEFVLDGNINYSNTYLTGIIDFTLPTAPEYEIEGNLDNLNLAMLLEQPDMFTDLNFNLNAIGKDLDIDNMTGELTIDLEPSFFRDERIDSTSVSLKLEREGDFRKILLNSELVDLTMDGEFSLSQAIDLVSYESSTISKIVTEKFKGFNPLAEEEKYDIETDYLGIPSIVDSNIVIDYNFEFNDFKLIAAILGDDKLDIAGTGSGQIKNNSDNFSISTNVALDYFVKRRDDDVFYLSEFEFDLNFSRDNSTVSFENLFGTVSATGGRMFVGSNVTNISADLIFNADKLFYNLYGEMEPDVKAEAEGTFELSPNEQIFNLNTLWVDYRNVEWENDESIKIEFYPDSTHLDNLNLINQDASLTADGYLLENGNQDLTFEITKLPGKIVDKYLLNTSQGNLKSEINLTSKLSGNLEDPIIGLDIDVSDVTVSGINFGNLLCDINYENSRLNTDLNFINSEFDLQNPLLKIEGYFPIYLGFKAVENRITEDDSLSIEIKSTNFDISTFGNLLPFIFNQSGSFNADLIIDGTINELNYYGNLSLPEATFTASDNNLDYLMNIAMDFKGNTGTITNFDISNRGGTNYGGTLYGRGNFILDGLNIEEFELDLNGELAILSNRSKGVSPSLYGDLVIASGSDWKITQTKDQLKLKADVLIKNTDIKFIPPKTSYTRSDRDFVYKILVDSSKLDEEEIKFDRLVSQESVKRAFASSNNSNELNFNYNVGVNIIDEAKLSFIFAKTVNQGLVAITSGKMNFESKDGRSSAQGAFTLLEGSKLEFFKTLDAEGTLRFESDLTNPYMDIVATYTGEYDENPLNEEVEEVAVKVKLVGPVDEIASNLTEESGNISVYRNRRNIENNIPDQQLDAADAIVFLILNKFKKDLTGASKLSVASEVASTATSLVGPVLTNFINSEIGDIVNDIQLSRTGLYTRFKVSGRYQKFRYSIGGTDQVFQNIQNANLKVEYLFTSNFLVRAERKDPYISYTSDSEFENKINELAIKYRFIF